MGHLHRQALVQRAKARDALLAQGVPCDLAKRIAAGDVDLSAMTVTLDQLPVSKRKAARKRGKKRGTKKKA